MTEQSHPVLLGCCGWNYPGWAGPFYPEAMEAGDYLTWYADRFPVVEIDSTFYRPPSPKDVRMWCNRTPSTFRFATKVPRVITHEKELRDCDEEVEGFVSSIEPLGEKLLCALLQMGYFSRRSFGSFEEFLSVLDAFLGIWPHERAPLAVEVRNPRWIGPELAEVLRNHGAAITVTDKKWMPTPAEIARRIDPITASFAYVRLMGDREATDRLTSTWDKIVVDKSADLQSTTEVIESFAERVPVAVFASNHYAGHSPATIRQVRALLGQAEPVPPVRPRTTLFD
jgi:uncharacterized protein YecE (DUF72 family)